MTLKLFLHYFPASSVVSKKSSVHFFPYLLYVLSFLKFMMVSLVSIVTHASRHSVYPFIHESHALWFLGISVFEDSHSPIFSLFFFWISYYSYVEPPGFVIFFFLIHFHFFHFFVSFLFSFLFPFSYFWKVLCGTLHCLLIM